MASLTGLATIKRIAKNSRDNALKETGLREKQPTYHAYNVKGRPIYFDLLLGNPDRIREV